LIELLVVVAIIAVLVSILLPAMSQARQQARDVRCGTYVRQLGLGMTAYHNEYDCYPAHQWRLPNDVRCRWFNAMADILSGLKVQGCPSVADWEVGRNNSYGYNYKYIGSARDNELSPKHPFENFPVKDVHAPAMTIAFACSDGTGWKIEHVNGVKNVDMIGNHGYTLDPTYIPTYSLETYSGGELEPYAWHDYRTYISDRHRGGSNACFADGHVSRVLPRKVYRDNALWNGWGCEDIERDPHVPFRYMAGEFRYVIDE
jgi:prepilin-type processing-associated H-X9-DG protein